MPQHGTKNWPNLLQQRFSSPLVQRSVDKLIAYYELARKWGQKINLTANLVEERYFTENLLDPICAYEALKSAHPELFGPNARFIDLGCGGGFVGLSWAIWSGGALAIDLLDSDRKKINFCKQVKRELGLDKVSVFEQRAELLIDEQKNAYTATLTRATWGWQEHQEISLLYLVPGGSAIGFQGNDFTVENNDKSPVELLCYDVIEGVLRRKLSLTNINHVSRET